MEVFVVKNGIHFLILAVLIPVFASAADFSECRSGENNGASADHLPSKTKIQFSNVDACRRQTQGDAQVICGCKQSLSGAQIFMAVLSGGTSLAASRQWSVTLECQSFGPAGAKVIRSIDFGTYEGVSSEVPPEGTKTEDQLMTECGAAESMLFNELNPAPLN
jgi:hypothetical protein